ncbi:copper-specific metallothionein-2-like [Artemia franciscana]|uniref:copper-specific metallothionein-2-like n=1 Tax=Artemia franciscana TaxID=6661 RepID=UPI0032DB9D50
MESCSETVCACGPDCSCGPQCKVCPQTHGVGQMLGQRSDACPCVQDRSCTCGPTCKCNPCQCPVHAKHHGAHHH